MTPQPAKNCVNRSPVCRSLLEFWWGVSKSLEKYRWDRQSKDRHLFEKLGNFFFFGPTEAWVLPPMIELRVFGPRRQTSSRLFFQPKKAA